jgi:hypothetical protein
MSYKKYYEGGWRSGETGGTPITPEALNHMENGIENAAELSYAKKVGALHNLLDNSDFRNPVNQRGATSTTTWAYCLDRWIARNTGMTLTQTNNGLTIKGVGDNSFIYQKISNPERLFGKTYTLACMDSNDNLVITIVTFPNSTPTSWTTYKSATAGNTAISVFGYNGFAVSVGLTIAAGSGAETTIKWIALYEGEYTADTLPEYQPKGHAAELLECQRYYWQTSGWTGFNGYKGSSAARVMIYLPTAMRTTPTLNASVPLRVVANGISYTDISVSSVELKGTTVNLFLGNASSIPKDNAIVLLPTTAGELSLSADL